MNDKLNLVPHLWFDTQAVEAAEFYCSLFPDSRIISKGVMKGTPSGDCDYLSFELWGQKFEALSGGPLFKLNPSISLMVNFDPLFFRDQSDPENAARGALAGIWESLIEGGTVMMELGSYNFSSLYGWVQDRFGLNWQLILTDPGGDPRPAVIPSMMFVGENYGKAREAGEFYLSLFESSEPGLFVTYPPEMTSEKEGAVMFSDFRLGETWLTANDSAYDHKFQFNEAFSFILNCSSQEMIDYYWSRLSAVPEAEACGWLKDQFGVSWQILPGELNTMMDQGNDEQKQAVTKAFLDMKKIDLPRLRDVYKEARGG